MDGPNNCFTCHAYEVKTKFNKQYYEASSAAEDCDAVTVDESFHEDIIVMSSYLCLIVIKTVIKTGFAIQLFRLKLSLL